MNSCMLSDVTLHQAAKSGEFNLSFKEKIEIAKLLDKLNISVIEAAGIENTKVDSLLIKSMAAAIHDSILSVPVKMSTQGVQEAWEAVKSARHPRLRVCVPVSPVQMEYLCHKKGPEILKAIETTVMAAKALCPDVEFSAQDATRAEEEFLHSAIATAIAAGATTVTLCDSAGILLPDEFVCFLKKVAQAVPQMQTVAKGASCSNAMGVATACSFAALQTGCREVKVAAAAEEATPLEALAQIIRTRGDSFQLETTVRFTQLQRSLKQIKWIAQSKRTKTSAFDTLVSEAEHGEIALTEFDDQAAVNKAVAYLGYDLSEEDSAKVFEEFCRIAGKKSVGAKELDAIVASVALQVPPTYLLESYVINSGSVFNASAHIQLKKGEKVLCGICVGDGPIDAAFLAIEQIIGHHYELDDFQIQAVTEGHEAMGSALIRLRSNGKLYSGRGISTDIIGSSIRAYVNALNKIVYEEN